MSKKLAPVQMPKGGKQLIPWEIHKRAWDRYDELGHGRQSAERVAERGGFGVWELVVLLAGGDPWATGAQGPEFTQSRRVWGLDEPASPQSVAGRQR